MATDVVHRYQGLVHGQRRRLGKVHAHQYRTDEAGGKGHGHGVDVIPCDACRGKRLVGQGVDGLHVLAGGNLRYHAAVEPVERHLRGNAVGEYLPPVLHHRHGGLVAGGFHCENFHSIHSFLRIRASSVGLV